MVLEVYLKPFCIIENNKILNNFPIITNLYN